ncbi:hypothetical protein N7517_000389 [Penicillium concentricum]|uniref:AMP-dependent synthetase/ligase domain-containing protein n=1 Tax=Penicillium concentricum TaxID=293559 RepID=A0A9W9VHJ7_9EURO|nr:uncharacterized protein N7517_000389 [Penicillium concentricum]KAJ5382478.1 hypothetical protein N7517_000389 [Penicillium concentricum]
MPVSSTFPSIEIPDVDLWTFLFERNDRVYPYDKIIYQDADTKRYHTYKSVKEGCIAFGEGLKAVFDWKEGEVLALFTPNSIDTPLITWGTVWAAGIVSPSNPVYTVEELIFHLKDSGAKALVTHMSVLPIAKEAAKSVGLSEDRIILLGDQHDPDLKIRHFTSIRNSTAVTRYRTSIIAPSKTCAFIVYSSGTTGTPKGVLLSHRNIISNILQANAGEGGNLTWDGLDGKGDRVLAFVPFYHIYGLLRLLHATLYTGYHLIVMQKFELEKWCAHVQDYRITFSYVVPPVVLLLTKHPIVDKYNLTTLRMLNCSGAPLTHELVDAVYKRIQTGIKQGYGLTEASPTSHNQAWEEWQTTIGSVGKLLPNMEAKYMSIPEDSSEPHEVEAGEVGELFLRGPNIFMGYHNNPEATINALSADGWLQTGDVGYQDSHGHFYITDRVKELIKYNGFQVAPAELEGKLVKNDAVADVAVVGIMSKAHGTEVPLAFIVRSEESKSSGISARQEAVNIAQWLEVKVAYYKRLRGGVIFIDSIPKSASGKILRRLLQKQAQEAVDGAVQAKL